MKWDLTLESVPPFTVPPAMNEHSEKRVSAVWRMSETRQGEQCDTLRQYERQGVLALPRLSANGYWQYPAEALR